MEKIKLILSNNIHKLSNFFSQWGQKRKVNKLIKQYGSLEAVPVSKLRATLNPMNSNQMRLCIIVSIIDELCKCFKVDIKDTVSFCLIHATATSIHSCPDMEKYTRNFLDRCESGDDVFKWMVFNGDIDERRIQFFNSTPEQIEQLDVIKGKLVKRW